MDTKTELLNVSSFSPVVPDVTLSMVDDTPHLLKPLLSALGITRRRPIPPNFEFGEDDPMGGELFKPREDDTAYKPPTSPATLRTTAVCEDLVAQVQKLKSLEEKMAALSRLALSVQVLTARQVTLMLVASLSVQTSKALVSTLRDLDLLDVHTLVRLLRLVDAGRIDGTPSKGCSITLPSSVCPLPALSCLSSAIAALLMDEGSPSAGLQLVQSCTRDLLTASVGGAELIQQVGRKWFDRHKPPATGSREGVSDVSALTNPKFRVSQQLVEILAKSAGRLVSGGERQAGNVVQLMDALTACLFSSKLEGRHRLWALQQLAQVLAVTGASEALSREQQARGGKLGGGGAPSSVC